MRFSTMTSLSNAPSRLTFAPPSTTIQTQRTGKIVDSNYICENFPQTLLEKSNPQLLQSESDQVRIGEIAEEVAPNCKRYLKISYHPTHASNQPLESYRKWLDTLVEGLSNHGLYYTKEYIHADPKIKAYILGIYFSRYNKTDLNTLKSLLSQNLLLI
jgi:hypothetical protein